MLAGFFCPLKKKDHETAKIVVEESKCSHDYGIHVFEVSLKHFQSKPLLGSPCWERRSAIDHVAD